MSPLWRAVGGLTPLGPLSELTAWLSRQWLELCGFSSSQQGLFLYLPGGGVKVAGACGQPPSTAIAAGGQSRRRTEVAGAPNQRLVGRQDWGYWFSDRRAEQEGGNQKLVCRDRTWLQGTTCMDFISAAWASQWWLLGVLFEGAVDAHQRLPHHEPTKKAPPRQRGSGDTRNQVDPGNEAVADAEGFNPERSSPQASSWS